MIHLPEGPNLRFSITPEETGNSLWVDEEDWGLQLARQLYGYPWKFGEGVKHSYDADETTRDGSIQISRDEALMILFSC